MPISRLIFSEITDHAADKTEPLEPVLSAVSYVLIYNLLVLARENQWLFTDRSDSTVEAVDKAIEEILEL